jgi:hypothetical protein
MQETDLGGFKNTREKCPPPRKTVSRRTKKNPSGKRCGFSRQGSREECCIDHARLPWGARSADSKRRVGKRNHGHSGNDFEAGFENPEQRVATWMFVRLPRSEHVALQRTSIREGKNTMLLRRPHACLNERKRLLGLPKEDMTLLCSPQG